MLKKLFNSQNVGLIVLAIVIAILPVFLTNAYYYEIAILIAINAIVVVSLNLLVGFAGQISLGHAGFFGLGMYSSGILTAEFGWPPILALIAGAIIVGIIAFTVARPVLRLQGHYLAMATLGLGIIFSIILSTEDWITGGPDGMSVPGFSFLGFDLASDSSWYWFLGVLLMVVVWFSLNIINSPAGRALRAVHGSEVAAHTAGIDTVKYKVKIFTFSAVVASIMGSFLAHFSGFITPDQAGFFHSIEMITMVVLGGMASTFGAVVGAAVLTVLPQLLAGFEDYEMVIFG